MYVHHGSQARVAPQVKKRVTVGYPSPQYRHDCCFSGHVLQVDDGEMYANAQTRQLRGVKLMKRTQKRTAGAKSALGSNTSAETEPVPGKRETVKTAFKNGAKKVGDSVGSMLRGIKNKFGG